MEFVHISDPHFGCSDNIFTDEEIVDVLACALSTHDSPYLVVTGDITYQGNEEGYGTAAKIFKEAFTRSNFNARKLLVCPGNHDVRDDGFVLFNRLTNELRGDTVFSFKNTNSCCWYLTSDLFCLSINSSYSLAHQFGLVDLEDIRSTLSLAKACLFSSSFRVAILHHHILNQFLRDKSVVKNAYELVALLDEFGFNLILHGHQHSIMSMKLGNTPILNLAVGSMNFSNPGFANGLNVYGFFDEKLKVTRYTYSRDRKSNGKIAPLILGTPEEY